MAELGVVENLQTKRPKAAVEPPTTICSEATRQFIAEYAFHLNPEVVAMLLIREIDESGHNADFDFRAVVRWFKSLLDHPEASLFEDQSRTHPRLRAIFEAASTNTPWRMREELEEFLTVMGIGRDGFTLAEFARNPVTFNRLLLRTIAEMEMQRVRTLIREGKRKLALDELEYLFEIAPGNPQTFELFRKIKRRPMHTATTIVGAILLAAGGVTSVIYVANRLGVEGISFFQRFQARPKPLEIEALEEVDAETSATEGTENLFEVHKSIRPLRSGQRPPSGYGYVLVNIDKSGVATFDSSAANESQNATVYRSGERAILPVGRHLVTLKKPGVPPALAEFLVRHESLVVLSDRRLQFNQ